MAESVLPPVRFKQSWLHIVAFLLIGVSALDLADQSQGTGILPFSLSEKTDLILLVVAGFILFFLS